MSKKISGSFALLGFMSLTLFLISCGSSSSRPAGVLYYLSQGENTVGSYAINLTNGGISLLNKTAPSDTTPSSILLDPTGKVAYVLNTGANTITTYTLNADGGLDVDGVHTEAGTELFRHRGGVQYVVQLHIDVGVVGAGIAGGEGLDVARGDQVGRRLVREHVEVIGGRGTAGERHLRETDEGRDVDMLGSDPRPDRHQDLEPIEQRGVLRVGHRARQVPA